MYLALCFVVALAGINAVPLTSGGVSTELYGDPLTHDQIIQLIKDHMNNKRQQLSLYGDPLTHDQIIQLIKDHLNTKRQQLWENPLTHDQIIQLIKDNISTTRRDNLLQSAAYRQLIQHVYGTINPLISISTIDQPFWSALIHDLGYHEILDILGEIWKVR
ncbi:hypothetical protein BgiBS90_026860 [Biomphalaria glabrata]|uniref:Uncharacterized protein n=1 Tax=Biomphalaria glabrata TaxID=6526 RepID=A0A2C9M5K8_BIOGL|nr:hypothetical protein BgiBS90_026860 [Biomphalaria glabrata]